MKKTYVIRDRGTGNIIETNLTFAEAIATMEGFYENDKAEGIYVPDCYEIAPSDDISEDINPYPKYPINGQPVRGEGLPDKKAIVDSIYKAYGSDSGVLFGIKERSIVEAIVEFTINRIK